MAIVVVSANTGTAEASPGRVQPISGRTTPDEIVDQQAGDGDF